MWPEYSDLFSSNSIITTGFPQKTASLENRHPLVKNYRAQIKLYDTLGILLHVHKCVSQNRQHIHKVLYSLFWAQ